MKKLLYLLGAAVLALGFTACNDDDDDNDELVKAAAGTYTTNLKIGTDEIIEDAKITIAKATNETVSFQLTGLTLDGSAVTVNTTGVAVSGTTSNVALSYDGAVAAGSDNKVKIEGTVKGETLDATMTFTIGDKTYTVKTTTEKPETPDVDFAADIVGTYEVELDIDIVEEPVEATITITRVNNTTVKLALDGLEIPPAGEISDIEVEGVIVGGEIGKVTFKNSGLKTTGNIMGGTVPITIDINGTIETGKDPEMNLNLDIEAGVAVKVVATGSRS